MQKHYLDKNTYTILPPLSEWIEAYLAAIISQCSRQHYYTTRMALRRVDQWTIAEGIRPEQITWVALHKLHDYIRRDGASNHSCRRALQAAKSAVRWCVANKGFPQSIADLYPTNNFKKHSWTSEVLPEMAEFIEEVAVGNKPHTARLHRFHLRVFNTFLQKQKIRSVKKIDRDVIIKFFQYIQSTSLSPQSRHTLGTKVRVFIKWLCARHYLKASPDEICPLNLLPKKAIHHPRPIDSDVDRRLLEVCRTSDDFYLKSILFLRLTGLRFAEFVAVEHHCVVKDDRGWASMRVPPVKLGIEHFVPLSEETFQLIEYFQTVSLSASRPKTPSTMVLTPNGKKLVYNDVNKEFQALATRLKVEKWINPHQLRHTFASSMLNAGMSLQSLQQILGHKTIIMTLKYAKLCQVKVREEFANATTIIKSKRGEVLPVEEISIDIQIARLSALIKQKIQDSSRRLPILKAISRVKTLCQKNQI